MALLACACSTAGNNWVADKPEQPENPELVPLELPREPTESETPRDVRVIGATQPRMNPENVAKRRAVAKSEGKSLGVFRNTYYHFPSETAFSGPPTPVYDRECKLIRQVPKEFHDAVCVQGSGLLESGVTISFARRDCECAKLCPRSKQKICFDQLDPSQFPWGRSAMGKGVVPLLTIAVDSDVIPLGTSVYIPEYEGLPRDSEGRAFHDGCFLAQDRGSKVKGKHVDIFTGDGQMTQLYNQLVPSNEGVTVVVDSPHCEREP